MNAKRTRRRTPGPRGWVVVITTAELFAEVPRLDFSVYVNNNAEDHRLRALFPLPFDVTRAITENQFHVAERSLDVPPWNGASPELPPTTFPQKTFAAFERDGHGVAIFNKGLQEGEVVRDRKGRQAYALTLLRCVGWLSRPDLTSRRGGAGPTIATPDAQMPGTHTFEYSLMTYEGNWHDAGVQAMAHSFAYPPLAFATNVHEGSFGREAPLATITPGVVPTALARSEEDGAPYVRAYNATGVPAEASIAVPAAGEGAGLVDLLERHQASAERADGAWSVPLRPWEIATVRFGRR
jgi:mannosylglycerate hydrolase